MAGITVPFIRLISDSFRMPLNNGKYIWRTISDAGLIAKATPGRGGSAVSFRDAAVFVTAAVAYRATQNLAEAMDGYMKMKAHHTARSMAKPTGPQGHMVQDWIEDDEARWHFDGFYQPQMKSLPKKHNFIDAFGSLLDAAANNDSLPVLVDPTVTISATYPVASIKITLHDMTPDQPSAFRYDEEAGYNFSKRTRPVDEEPGVEFEATIPARIIREIATLIKA